MNRRQEEDEDDHIYDHKQPLLDMAMVEPKCEQPRRSGSAMDGQQPRATTTNTVAPPWTTAPDLTLSAVD
ncbi:hypothetical protein NL676_028040 [Syzygium grande]|nr:hypothetical protein NL676_028040 [Syzygium grande]